MKGTITEKQIGEAEAEFPGILTTYLACEEEPATFLDLLARYLRAGAARSRAAAAPIGGGR